MASKAQFDLRFETSNLDYSGIHVHIALTVILIASEAIAASKQSQRSHLTSELNSVTSTTLVPMCILPLTAILVASEVWYPSCMLLVVADCECEHDSRASDRPAGG